MVKIHSTACVDAAAELDSSVTVGPYTTIGPNVRIGARTTIGSHCVIEGRTTIGVDNQIFQFNSLGAIPQDKKYAGEPCELVIGDRNTIREFCTFNIGTANDKAVTRLGNDNWIMAYVHLAHDCQIGDHTVFANSTQLAGHVEVGDWAILGGFTVVHQFCRIGAHSFTAMNSLLFADLPPFAMCQGQPAQVRSMNYEGLKRRGYTLAQTQAVKQMHKLLYRDGLSLAQSIEQIQMICKEDESLYSLVELMVSFLLSASPSRGIVR
ncbi:MAG: acyl-ACP--UDP-N-acetylglucosamine O-acyltransferase [Limnohabitans sp.]